MRLYTAQYKYAGDDRLDITVKGKDPIGLCFAPTWKMVMESKEGKISWDEYKQMYRELMQKSYRKNLGVWNDILSRGEVRLFASAHPGRTVIDTFWQDTWKNWGLNIWEKGLNA